MDAVIERGIPLPPPRNPATTVAGFVRALGPGESVAFPIKSRAAAIAATYYVRRSFHGRQFVVRTVENGTRVRVWRAA